MDTRPPSSWVTNSEDPRSGFSGLTSVPSSRVVPILPSSARHRLSIRVMPCPPAETSACLPPVDLHSWKNRCVLGFSRISATVDTTTGLSVGVHASSRLSSCARPPPATKCAQFLVSGTQHLHVAYITAALNAMGTAWSVTATASTKLRRMATPSARRRIVRLPAHPSHSAARSAAAASFTGSSLVTG